MISPPVSVKVLKLGTFIGSLRATGQGCKSHGGWKSVAVSEKIPLVNVSTLVGNLGRGTGGTTLSTSTGNGMRAVIPPSIVPGAEPMLQRINPRDVEYGMYVHAIEGRWADQPCWRSQCVLDDEAEVERLRKSVLTAIVIDTERGRSGASSPRKPAAIETTTAGLRVGKVTDPNMKGLLQTVGRSRREVMRIVEDVRLGRPISVARLGPVLIDLTEQVERNASAFLGILRLKARDEYTYLHSVAVSALMMNFARALDVPEEERTALGMAGLLHDVGKIAMPPAILNKPRPADRAGIRGDATACRDGARILKAGTGIPDAAFDVCLHHHERMDGKGYPFGLTGDALSLAARMGAICDVYDALTSHRPYKDAWPPQKALAEMQTWHGHFRFAVVANLHAQPRDIPTRFAGAAARQSAGRGDRG